jgi:spermidine synthase
MKKRSLLWALGILSAATLALEIDLTRLLAVAQFYHLSFMIVSLALLGFGASGTLLAVWPRLRSGSPHRTLSRLGWGFAATTLGAYLLTLYLPFDSFAVAIDRRQWGVLALHYLALSTPFACCGLAVSLLLAAFPEYGHRFYAANLVGSAIGCLLAVLLSLWVGGEGVVALAGALGIAAAWVCTSARQTARLVRLVRHVVYLGAVLLLVVAALRVPAWFEIRLSPYKDLSYLLLYPDAEPLSQRWNSISRVDVVRSSSIRSLPGSGFSCAHPPPAQLGLTVDGDSLSPISQVSTGFSELPYTDCLLSALPYRLRPGARGLVLEPSGGFGVLVALGERAGSVTAVVANPLVVEAVRQQGVWAGHIYADPRVQVVTEEGRSYVKRTQARYDVIDLALTEPQRTIVSGAYSLSENYAYTVEAFLDQLDRLTPDGLLVVTRWLQVPPSESVRAFALAVEAVERSGGTPETDIVALRSYRQMMILVRRSAFTGDELRTVRRFAEERRFDLVYLPDLRPDEVNRFSVLPESSYYNACRSLLDATDRDAWARSYTFDVRPPTDDRPFFGHFFRWQQMPELLAVAGYTWQPFGGAGYLVLLVLLGLAVLAAGLTILLPLAIVQGATLSRKGGGRVLAYFCLLGLGYLSVEIPLMQRFSLFLGHPTWSMAVVLFGILVFSGIGSRLSARVPIRAVLIGVPALVGGYVLGLPVLFEWGLVFPLWARLLVSIVTLAPLGLLMGMPFPKGVALLRQPSLVAWAWAGNGALSVIASILAALISLGWGFSAVLAIGAGCYLAAMAVRPRSPAR